MPETAKAYNFDPSDAAQSYDENTTVISEPQNMKNVREAYTELEETISQLGTNIGTVLENQENEFVTTFKSKMNNVQSIYDTLKDDIAKREEAIQDLVLVKQLEEERDWYKKQALHLDKTLLETKKRESELLSKVEEIEQDRSWLSNQLKVVMKQKNLLERQRDLGHEKESEEINEDEDCEAS